MTGPNIPRQVPSIPARPCDSLTDREKHITVLVAQGLKNREIAEKLETGEQRIKDELHDIFDKVGCDSRLQLALWYVNEFSPNGTAAADHPRKP